ncbi:MAG TPA: hypothetical protein VJV39_18820 [Dongiaceae bacterium]|nr:hypothetical protein [Dongiaceae bacterium]
MFRSLFALTILTLLAPAALAGQSSTPILALWEFDGWAPPTAERPLGLRFVLLEDGSVIFAPDDPAIDVLIPNQYFQARLLPDEAQALTTALMPILQQQSAATSASQDGWTAFYFRDPATGEERHAAVPGHPCLAKGRVFSATVPAPGLRANRNSADRAALPPEMRQACNLLAGFHHASTQPWSPEMLPAFVPQH